MSCRFSSCKPGFSRDCDCILITQTSFERVDARIFLPFSHSHRFAILVINSILLDALKSRASLTIAGNRVSARLTTITVSINERPECSVSDYTKDKFHTSAVTCFLLENFYRLDFVRCRILNKKFVRILFVLINVTHNIRISVVL